MRFGFIADGRVFYPVVVMCKVMRVSRSGFYSYLARVHQKPSVCEQENASLLAQIEVIFEESSKRYGSPRIHAELRKRRVVCSLRRVKRLMRQAGLYALPKRKYKHRKTPSALLNGIDPI